MERKIIDSVETLEAALARVKEAQKKFSVFTQEQVDEIVDENLREGLGFSECTFSNFFFNFSRSLRYFGVTGRYYFNLVLSYAVAGAGAFWMYKKATR